MLRAPEGGIRVTVRRGDKLIRADYAGGPYVELTFGSEAYAPTEVINVWDYENNQPEIKKTSAQIRECVVNWMKAMNYEWPEWYEGYLENARH